jgi:hypothetical protein
MPTAYTDEWDEHRWSSQVDSQGLALKRSIASNKPRRPTDPNEQPVWSTDPDFVEAPLAVAQHTTRTNDQVVHPRGDSVNVRRANENADEYLSRPENVTVTNSRASIIGSIGT